MRSAPSVGASRTARTRATAAASPARKPHTGPGLPLVIPVPRHNAANDPLNAAAADIVRRRRPEGAVLRSTSEYQRAVGAAEAERIL